MRAAAARLKTQAFSPDKECSHEMTAEPHLAKSEGADPEQPSSGSSWRAAIAIMGVALVLGGGLRFYHLDATELDQSEAVLWLAACAPTIGGVIRTGLRYEPGTFGVYEIVLHGWINRFGDGIVAMRVLSAILGTLAILLLFVAVREIFDSLDEGADPPAELVAAFAALIFACNLQMIASTRVARMYSLVLVLVFAQIFFFVRSHRRTGILNCVAAAVLTALAVASHYAMVSFFTGETLWLVHLWYLERGRIESISLLRPAIALALAAVLFAPLLVTAVGTGAGAFHSGILDFIEPQPPWWPLRALRTVSGNAAFWPFAGLAIFGVWYRWNRARRGTVFVLLWLVTPFALALAVSYTITPFMVVRYVLLSFVAFFVLVALGLASLPGDGLRYGLAAVVIAQSLAHVHHDWQKLEYFKWREAAEVAASSVQRGEKIAILPAAALAPVLYYLPRDESAMAIPAGSRCGPEPVLIVFGLSVMPRDAVNAVESCYPRTLRSFGLLEVRARLDSPSR